MRRIAILGWADVDRGASEGGGYNLVAQQHALQLAAGGAAVYALQSGSRFRLSSTLDITSAPHIRFLKHWRGIDCFGLVDSSNRAPSVFNHANRRTQIEDAVQDGIVCDWLAEARIEELFIHSLEGQALSLIRAVKRSGGVRVSVFCHDHFYLCTQVQLLYRGTTPCADYRGGARCEECLPAIRERVFAARQAALQFLRRPGAGPVSAFLLRCNGVRRRLRENARARARARLVFPALGNEDLWRAVAIDRSDLFYARRRRAALAALSAADRVFCPSRFLAGLLERGGVAPALIVPVRIGLPHLDALRQAAAVPAEGRTETVFCYRGSAQPHKGLDLFLEAIGLLSEDTRRRCRFIVRGIDNPALFRRYRKAIPELSLHAGYDAAGLGSFVGEYDIGVLPHLWFENSPLTLLEHLAGGKPVLAARLGGAVDYVREGENGWFFRPGDARDLSEKIAALAGRPRPDPESIRPGVESAQAFFRALDAD